MGVLKAQKALAEGDAVTVPYNIGVTTTADVLLNHGAVPASRLDGSSYADARLLARHPDTDIPGSPADDRAMAEDVGTPAGAAAPLAEKREDEQEAHVLLQGHQGGRAHRGAEV